MIGIFIFGLALMGIGISLTMTGFKILKKPEAPAKIRVNFVSTFNSNTHINGLIYLGAGIFMILTSPVLTYFMYQDKQVKIEHKNFLIPFNKFVQSHNFQFKEITKDEKPYIRGKLIPINSFYKKVYDIYFKIPINMRATDTSKIETYLDIFYTNDTIASYTNHSYSIQRSCTLQIIDLKEKKVVYKGIFQGTAPKENKTIKDDDLGGDPADQIISFIKTLPIVS